MENIITRTFNHYTVKCSKIMRDERGSWVETQLPDYETNNVNETYERFLKKHFKDELKEGEKLVINDRITEGKTMGMSVDTFLKHALPVKDRKLVIEKEQVQE